MLLHSIARRNDRNIYQDMMEWNVSGDFCVRPYILGRAFRAQELSRQALGNGMDRTIQL